MDATPNLLGKNGDLRPDIATNLLAEAMLLNTTICVEFVIRHFGGLEVLGFKSVPEAVSILYKSLEIKTKCSTIFSDDVVTLIVNDSITG